MASKRTKLVIHNRTGLAVKNIEVGRLDDFDWDGVSRPDNNINGKSMQQRECIAEREEINALAGSCGASLVFEFSDGKKVAHSINMKDAMKDNHFRTEFYPVAGGAYNFTVMEYGFVNGEGIPVLGVSLHIELKF